VTHGAADRHLFSGRHVTGADVSLERRPGSPECQAPCAGCRWRLEQGATRSGHLEHAGILGEVAEVGEQHGTSNLTLVRPACRDGRWRLRP
jgi:hypothetical protein